MKMLSAAIGGLGAVALLAGVVVKLLSIQSVMGTSAGGFVRGATALCLLALVVMVYDHWYAGTAGGPPSGAAKT